MSENMLADEAAYFGAVEDGKASMQEELAAANERIRELEDQLFTTTEHYKTAAAHRGQLTDQLTAEREVLLAEQALSDKLEKALKLADIQYMGCGGNLQPEEIVSAMQSVIRAALAEVAAIRKGDTP